MEKKLNNKPILLDQDVFTEVHEEYSKTKLSKRLNEKYRIKPYFEKYKNLKISTKISSYLFNTLSALAASSLVFFFMRNFVSARFSDSISMFFAISITFLFIGLIEWKKRETLSRFLSDIYQFGKIRFGLIGIMLLIFGISISFSYFGGEWAIVELTPAPELVSKDSLEKALVAQIATINSQIKEAENTKWRGTTTSKSQEAKKTLVAERLMVNQRLLSIQESVENKNGVIQVEHESSVKFTAANFALFVICCEILFIFCLMYMEFYDYRSHSEMVALSGVVQSVPVQASAVGIARSDSDVQVEVVPSQEVPSLNLDEKKIDQIIEGMKLHIEGEKNQNLLTELKAYKSSAQRYRWKYLNADGKPETAIKNILRATEDFEKASKKKLLS